MDQAEIFASRATNVSLYPPEIWQEYDCPISGIDVDLDEIVAVGEQFYCLGCGENHTATLNFPKNTYVRLVQNGELQFRRTPADSKEKEEWLAEVATAVQQEKLRDVLQNIES